MPLKDPEKRKEYHRKYIKDKYNNDLKYKISHKTRTKINDIKYSLERKAILLEFKKDGCFVCSEKEQCCMSAHHLNPTEKEFNIGDAVSKRYSSKRLKIELAKCICVCENCHRKIHAGIIVI